MVYKSLSNFGHVMILVELGFAGIKLEMYTLLGAVDNSEIRRL